MAGTYKTGDFQCPDSGVPIIAIWDPSTQSVEFEVHSDYETDDNTEQWIKWASTKHGIRSFKEATAHLKSHGVPGGDIGWDGNDEEEENL